jgi:hypothetical protein
MDALTAKRLAYVGIESLEYVERDTPTETLKTINFGVSAVSLQYSQEEFVKLNLSVDKRSCLGRAAQAAAVVEKHFPSARVELGEVRRNYLAEMMVQMLFENRSKSLDPSFMSELLMYEEPHLVVVIDGQQFEPLSIQLGCDIFHPEVATFPIWEGVASAVTVSESHLENHPQKKLDILWHAEEVCSGMSLVQENICGPMAELGLETLSIVEKCYQVRPCARTLFVLVVLSRDYEKYREQLDSMYTSEIIKYF